MDEALERIELKIAYLEQALQELGDVVYRQQRDIEALKQRLAAAQDRLDALRSEEAPPVDEQRPPHY
ncbi:MAG TPA: SlyX family protein [Gammaproteobacteria bacterium]|nr:SlyX family protein [Gammaproteobacteria bacterium]